jgi:hypothetical protein
MYSKISEEVDNKMAERYQRGGDATLIFVSPIFLSFGCSYQPENIGRFILSLNCCITHGVYSRPETKPTGNARILSQEYLPGFCQPEHISWFYPTSFG